MTTKQTPIISFCIPTYNRAKLVESTVKKILEYSGNDIEVVVVDNNSPDNTQQRIKNINDSRISYYRNDKNLGASLNIIETFKRAKGEWIYTLSDEDFVTSDITEKLLKILSSNYCSGVAVILGNLKKVYNDQHMKYLNAKYKKGDQAIVNVGFSHLYLSGILINKNYLDFEYLNNYTVESGGMYPYVNAFTMACKSGDAITLDTEICINGERVNKQSFIEMPDNKSFKHPANRLWQFKVFTEIANDIIENVDLKILKICLIYEHFLKLSTYHWENILKIDFKYYHLDKDEQFDFNQSLSNFYEEAIAHLNDIIINQETFDIINEDIKMKNFIIKQRRRDFLNKNKL